MTSHDHGNLAALARAVDAGSDRLREHLDEFEGGEVANRDTGQMEVRVGVRARYEYAVADAADAIFEEYENAGKRPPPESVRLGRARRQVQREDPDLFARYHALAASVENGRTWLTQKRAAVSALQTLYRAEGSIAGVRS